MWVIDTFGAEVRQVVVSADGRVLAALFADHTVVVWDWGGGERWRAACPGGVRLALSPDGEWLAACGPDALRVWPAGGGPAVEFRSAPRAAFVGGVAFTPDGKYLVASRDKSTTADHYLLAGPGQLARWSVPGWQPAPGFDDHWPLFPRLAVSPDGDYVAGIGPRGCELRFARSGGKQGWVRVPGGGGHTHLAFAPDSRTLVCGWDAGLHVMDTGSGRETRPALRAGRPVRDVAYTGDGRHVGTVDGTALLRLWDAGAWVVDREFDWAAGPLTALAFTADGVAGVCGTGGGQLVLFDLD